MANSSLQDIICCIGHPVSANPTQYVIERALTATALDFRCLTLDVPPDQFPAAVAGVKAMGFCGVVVAAPHQVEAGKYLDSTKQEFIDLIYWDGDRLVGEATVGSAVLQLVQARWPRRDVSEGSAESDPPANVPSTALVLGNNAKATVIARSLVDAGVTTTIVSSDANAAESTEVAVPTTDADGKELESGSEPATDEVATNADTLAGTAGPDAIAPRTPPQASESTEQGQTDPLKLRTITLEEMQIGKVSAELIVGAPDVADEIPGDLPQLDASKVVVDLITDPVRTDLLRRAEAADCRTINGVEVQLQMLIMAFQRWTGMDPDEQIMREALEEFLLV